MSLAEGEREGGRKRREGGREEEEGGRREEREGGREGWREADGKVDVFS